VITLKRNIDLRFGIVALVVVLVISVYFLWHASVDQPAYIGLNAPHPASMTGQKKSDVDLGNVTQATANQIRIPGRSFNPDNAGGAPTPSGQLPASGQRSGQ